MRFSSRLSALTDKASLPPGLSNAYFFALFNALSFQVVLSSPMVLYAKSLHASATVLGIITGMMPLLVIFQIPAASYISRVGYKRFVFAGWGTRVSFIFGMALVPLTGSMLNEGSRLGLILALLFGFNLSRGISSCAWLPWISALVPAEVRGTYLARDAACVNLASFLSLSLAALGLGSNPQAWRFAMLFAFSAVMGAVSLTFLKRIPDRPSNEETGGSKGPVPWGAMLRFRPFQKLLWMVVTWSLAYGGITAFSVVFLKSGVGMSEGRILLLSSVSYLGGLWSLWFIGSRVDGLGSKPVLTFSLAFWAIVLMGWLALAGGRVKAEFVMVLTLQLLMGLFAALITMSNTRLAMAVIPAMGRNHFFALYSVITNLALGLAPIGWGIVIDAIGEHEASALGLNWNRFSIFFAAAAIVMLAALSFARRLEEPKAASLETLLKEILIQSPQRVLVRLWPRE